MRFFSRFLYSSISTFSMFALAMISPAFCGPIHEAARKGDLPQVRALLRANPELVNSKDENLGATPLFFVAAGDNKDMAELLLANKADVNLGSRDGQTPLHIAAAVGNKAMVELLLAHGADVNARDYKLGETPSGWARLKDHTELAESLRRFAAEHAERYRALTSEDGLSCKLSQDLSLSLSGGFSGNMSASANHFKCKDKASREVEIELISTDYNR